MHGMERTNAVTYQREAVRHGAPKMPLGKGKFPFSRTLPVLMCVSRFYLYGPVNGSVSGILKEANVVDTDQVGDRLALHSPSQVHSQAILLLNLDSQ